jgi:hypothetical protein
MINPTQGQLDAGGCKEGVLGGKCRGRLICDSSVISKKVIGAGVPLSKSLSDLQLKYVGHTDPRSRRNVNVNVNADRRPISRPPLRRGRLPVFFSSGGVFLSAGCDRGRRRKRAFRSFELQRMLMERTLWSRFVHPR